MRTVSPFAGPAAYGLGVDAAKMGQNEDACPFPEGGSNFSDWLMGFLSDADLVFRTGQAVGGTRDAWREGNSAAFGAPTPSTRGAMPRGWPDSRPVVVLSSRLTAGQGNPIPISRGP